MLTMLGFSDAMAQKIYKAELDKSMFKAWDSYLPGANEAYYPDYNYSYLFTCEDNLYKEIGPGSVVMGNPSVYYLFYADITGTNSITFKGSSGMQLRVLMNRPEPVDGGDSNGGPTVERNVTIGDDGTATLDLSDLDYIHLNSIKCGWGSASGTITSVLLEGTVKPVSGLLSMINNGDAEGDDLSSFPVSLDGPNNGDTANERPEIIAGEGVNGSKCFKVTAFDNPTETWHSQFYIKADEVMPKGSKWKLKMSIKADQNVIITSSAQGQPHQWKGDMGLGEFGVTTEWMEYSWTGEIGVDDFQTIAFDLCNEYGTPGNAGVSFYFDNIEFGIDLGGSNPISDVKVAAGCDVIRIDFGGNTNMKELVKAASTKTLIFGKSTVSVTVDGESFDESIVSVEGYEDGNLYIFLEEDIYDENEVKVAFKNPEDAAHQLFFTAGKYEGQPVPEFSGMVAPFDNDLANAGYVSYLYGEPEMVEIIPEKGSFNLTNDVKVFTVTFNQPVLVSSVVAKLGAEKLTASADEDYSTVIKLTRTSDTALNGVVELVISKAVGKAGDIFGLASDIVVKYSYGAVALDGDDQPEVIYASDFSDTDEGRGAGWYVNAGSALQPANSGSGCRIMHNQGAFAEDLVYIAQRDAANGGVAVYGIDDENKLALEAGKTYHVTLKACRHDRTDVALRVQVLPEAAVSAEDGSLIDPDAVLAEDFKAITPGKTSKQSINFDLAVTPSKAGNFVIRLVPSKENGSFAGYDDAVCFGDVKVEYIPNVIGIVETKTLLAALESAKTTYGELASNEDNRYVGEDLMVLQSLISEVEANMPTYTSPSVLTLKANELTVAAKAANDHKDACDTYDKAITETTELVAKFKDTKFAPTSYYQNLVKIARKYHATSEVTIITNPETGEDEFVIVATFDVLKDNEALAVASDEVVSVNLLAAKWLTEGKSEKGWNFITTGYAALHERIRRGVELLKSLGIADDDPLIVAAEAEFGDNDEIAEAIAFRAKSQILDDLAKGEKSTLFEDEEASYDLSVFFKNPNAYANAYSTEVPGWTSVQGNCFAWSNWDSSQNHSVGTPYPEDCEIHGGWHPNPYAMVEQTVYDLPTGVYVVNIKCSDNGNSWDEGTCAFVRTSESPVIEAGQYIDRDMDFATYLTGSGGTEEITVTDGQLTIGFYYGNQSQAFFDDIELRMIAPVEGYDYGASQGKENNSLYIAEGQRFSKTKTNVLPISLKNEDDILGFQFDVVLPKGMTLALDDEDDYSVSGENVRAKNHSLSCNVLGDGTIRIVGTNLSNKKIASGDGILLNMGINVASWVENGDYAIQLKEVKVTNTARQTLTCSNKSFMVTVGGKLGDVNHDEAVDVTDAVLIIDHILMKYPSNFDASLADVNGDSYIDVTDVVMVIDAILGKIELARGAEMIDRSAYTAFQMDLTIPAGYVLESVSLTDIAKDSHTLAYNMLADGRCRVVVCSMNNEALPGAWDEVISLNLRGKGDAQVNIERAVFVTIDGERHELMLNPTSIAEISNLKSQTSNLYDLQGRKIEKSVKGILIENGKKTIRK